jgi:peptide/nickel transport system substrate-binding protein
VRTLKERSFLTRLLVILLALTMVAAACGDDDDDTTGDTTDTTAAGEGEPGGSVVFAAEQWPECLNPVTSCSNASWMHWAVVGHVLPRLMELDENNEFAPSPLLVGEPEVTEDPFTLTYELNPDAVWDDGTPITSEDIAFTWQAYLNTPGTLSATGYDKIDNIDSSDPQTAVIEFSEPYADWGDLFGGNQWYVLKAEHFGGDIAGLENEMLDEMPFSGGPFIVESFSAEQAVLVRNDAYWDEERVPLFDQVTMIPRTDTATEVNSLLSGESQAIFPQPSPGIAQQLDEPNIDYVVGAGSTFEGLWFNAERPPIDSQVVREAVAYAVDRQAIVDTIMKPIVPEIEVLNCAGWVPTVGPWCDNTDFADLTYDPDRAKELLEADGWALGGDGVYAKGGQRLSIPWATVTGNVRREDTQQLVIEQAKAAGIEFTLDNSDAGDLFENRVPRRDFTMAEFANITSPDPNSINTLYLCAQIPTEENDYSGQNFLFLCDEDLDTALEESARTLDEDARLELIQQAGDIVREHVAWLPLYQLPNIVAFDTDTIDGPIGAFASHSYGGFGNMYDWFVK